MWESSSVVVETVRREKSAGFKSAQLPPAPARPLREPPLPTALTEQQEGANTRQRLRANLDYAQNPG
jgi:hypothetical protein